MLLVIVSILLLGFVVSSLTFAVGVLFAWPVAVFLGISEAAKNLHIPSCSPTDERLKKFLLVLQALVAPFIITAGVVVAVFVLMALITVLITPIVVTAPALKVYYMYLTAKSKFCKGNKKEN